MPPPRPALLALALAGTLGPAAAGARAAPLAALAQGREEARAAAAEVMPGSPEGLRRYAATQARARRFPQAIRAYERLLQLAPADAEAQSRLAQLRAWTGDYDRAIVGYREAIARRPRDLGLKSDLADVLTWARRLEEAERLYEEVLAADSGHREALKGLARARLLRGDLAGAGPVLERALGLFPQDVDLHRDRARMLTQRGDLAGAVEALGRAVALAPADADLARHLADVLLRRQDWRAAADAWGRVAQLDPDSAASHVGMARAYLGLGKQAMAEEHVRLALRMSPADAAAHQLAADLEREASFAPVRSAGEAFELGAYLVMLVLVLLGARKTGPSLRRRPAARAFALYVVPAFLVLSIAGHLVRPLIWRWIDPRLLEAATEVVLLLGLGVAFLAVLRAEPAVREFGGQVVLAIGAHPDDLELGAAGFLLKLKASGARVHGLVMTRGEKGTDDPARRADEARRAAEFLELDGHAVLDFPDTGLQEKIPQMRAVIEGRIQELGATVVLTHTDVDVHGDHRAVHAATREAARAVPTVLCYEDVSTSREFAPNLYVDIGPYLEDHLRACALHRSQEHRSYMDPKVIEGRAAHRGLQAGTSFALAFRTMNLVR